ncbi:MAG: TonB-dependent receptor, partial [Gammaproteobacteria bacterium]
MIDAAEPPVVHPTPAPGSLERGEEPQVYSHVIPVDTADKTDRAPIYKLPPERSRLIEEVIVTARRTSENMQDVPVSISAMSESDLRRENINSAQDLQGKVPSLVISSNSQMRNTETPAIRGQGAQFGASPGVIIYLAEVPLPSDLVANNQGGPGKFFDLQNLQILKGSQGTLFGRNTTGGALLIEPHRPEAHFSASLRAEMSSLSGQGYEAVLNAPLVDETLLARVGFKYFDRDGFTRDVVTGKDYDNKHFWTSRAALTWRPTDGIENYLMGYYTVSRDNGTGTVIEDINRDGANRGILGAIGLDALPPIFSGPIAPLGVGCFLLNVYGPSSNCGQDILDAQRARGIRRVELSGDPNDILDTGGVVNNFTYRFDNGLTLRDIASYSVFEHHFRWDLDGSRAEFIDYNNADDQMNADLSTITNELQLQGEALDENLTFVVGGYYERTEATGISLATALFIERIEAVYEQKKVSYAPFVQATYDLGGIFDSLSGLNLTAGARYTFDETRGFAQLTQVAAGFLTTVDNPHEAKLKSTALTYTVGLDYHLGPSLLFGKVSRGYKTGGISVISVNPDHFTYD